MKITQAYLKQRLHYDPETGVFTWLPYSGHKQRWNKKHAGKIAGARMTIGYLLIRIDGQQYLAHRLAFLYMTGKFPPNQVDHKNYDRSNNSWANLRPATKQQNMRNRKAQKNNTTGFKGVYFHRQMNKYGARIKIGIKCKSLGLFDTAKAASIAYANAAHIYFGEFARS